MAPTQRDLPISGMTCALPHRAQLNELEGVSASVNYATEKASVSYEPGAVAPEQLIGAIEAAGYTATLPPALQFDYWQWLELQLTTPVILWGAWPFHRAAWANLKHGTATMDTLASLGTLTAFAWSLYALFLGDAGMTGMTMTFELIPARAARIISSVADEPRPSSGVRWSASSSCRRRVASR